MTNFRAKAAVRVVVAGMLLAACARGPLTVANVQLGSALNSDNSVATHVSRFKPDQTVYVAVLTGGPGSGEITARWTFGGRVINEETRRVSYTQGAATEFHINYAGGFPRGEYRVEVLVDGESVATRDFRIEP
jgi:hypothetical protein